MKGTLLRLLLLLVVLAAISQAQAWRVDTGTSVTLAAGALLLCGLFAGKVAKGVGLPRLTGYLLVGVVVGPYALGFIPGAGIKGLELVKGLAVSLIALVAGTESQDWISIDLYVTQRTCLATACCTLQTTITILHLPSIFNSLSHAQVVGHRNPPTSIRRQQDDASSDAAITAADTVKDPLNADPHLSPADHLRAGPKRPRRSCITYRRRGRLRRLGMLGP